MFRRLSLPAKATLLLTLVVFGVVLALTYLMAQSSKSVIEDDYRKRSLSQQTVSPVSWGSIRNFR